MDRGMIQGVMSVEGRTGLGKGRGGPQSWPSKEGETARGPAQGLVHSRHSVSTEEPVNEGQCAEDTVRIGRALKIRLSLSPIFRWVN